MPISCHFQDGKVLLVMTRESRQVAAWQVCRSLPLTFTHYERLILDWRRWYFSRRKTKETCRSRWVTRRSAHCWGLYSISDRVTKRNARMCRKSASTRCTRSTLYASRWVLSYHVTVEDSSCLPRARRRSSSKSNALLLSMSARPNVTSIFHSQLFRWNSVLSVDKCKGFCYFRCSEITITVIVIIVIIIFII